MASNNWYVITGGPCSGKTTLLNNLKKRGYKVVPESARHIIEKEMSNGKSLSEVRLSEIDFQEDVLDMKVEAESKLSQDEVIFFDRGIPDSVAYYRLYNSENDPHLKEAVANCSYKKVFFLEMVPYEKDNARIENEAEAKKLERYLREAYEAAGFSIVTVPVFATKEERVNFVLSNL